jgi:DNA-3-methyladenine glycosylase II
VADASASFTLEPRGPFSLAEARRFLASFGPAGQSVGPEPDALVLAFAPDGADAVVAVRVTQAEPDGVVHGEPVAGDVAAPGLAAQVARILSLDRDATGWAELGQRDGVLGAIQQSHPGLRPVLFSSPYEAAAWSIVSSRIAVAQAVGLRARLVEATGCALEHAGERLLPFPPPQRLLALDELPLGTVKAERLRAVAEAALRGELDADRLRALEPADAIAALRRLPGLGPFYASLVLIRAVGTTDVLAENEPRVRAAAARAYGDPALEDPARFAELAEGWRPWRSWAAFALRAGATATA